MTAETDQKKDTVTFNRCNKHGALRHHFFVSYRVDYDKVNAEKLAALLDGVKRPSGSSFRAYLDKNCLNQGQDWKFGFDTGLKSSNCILLLLSEGTIISLKNKALEGREDNVLHEHIEALNLAKDKRATVIPIYIASAYSKLGQRDYYVNMSPARCLGLVADDNLSNKRRSEKVEQQLLTVRDTVQRICELPGVTMEPDSIADKIPHIFRLYMEGRQKLETVKSRHTTLKEKAQYYYTRLIRNPSATYRLTLFGLALGFFLTILSFLLLYIPSISAQRAALKRGIAYGTIVGISALIIICAVFINNYTTFTSGSYCSDCESIVVSNGPGEFHLLELSAPGVPGYLNDCNCTVVQAYQNTSPCLSCVCAKMYNECQLQGALVVVLYACMGVCAVFILAAALHIHSLSAEENHILFQ